MGDSGPIDFGVGTFLRMFEERFGRVPTTLLVAAVGGAIFVVAIGTIWAWAVVPAMSLMASIEYPTPAIDVGFLDFAEVIARLITGLVMAFALGAVLALIVSWMLYVASGRSLRKSRVIAEVAGERLLYVIGERYGLSDEERNLLRSRIDRAETPDELSAALDEARDGRVELVRDQLAVSHGVSGDENV